ncbi:MAG: bifunctional 5,10-methylenetetrahydrofolate dehydrogenase/5,10-methenyltetrahydrofolate cyclohydrolase [Patescibacteria group bacterium]|nr:bifunctional 5,10-methylenetetrahydrofolate dehydrogenase/5,10-methenyltetrahydrofolate cyclohydrolase [Patescibacteria group bacterium]
MPNKIIDGQALAEKIKKNLKNKISKTSFTPGLAVILVGDDKASHLYVSLKEKACQKVGFHFEKHLFNAQTQEKEIIEKVENLNKNSSIAGIIVQLPLPRHLDQDKIIKKIDWRKDVDGFHPFNIKKILEGQDVILPGLIKSVLALLKKARVSPKKKKIALLANSDVLIKPLKYILEKRGGQVEIKKQGDYFQDTTRQSDIIIIAYGRPNLIKESMIKEGATIIDIGFNRLDDKKSVGDVDFEDVKDKVKKISPVPGGVGPLTVAFLLENTYLSAQYLNKVK